MEGRRGTFLLLRLGGVALRIHYSGIVTLFFFLWLASQRMRLPVLLSMLGGRDALAGPWTWGALLAGGLALGMVVHQLAHAATARVLGGRLRTLTLWVLGGCACDDSLGARRRALVAAAGPVASLGAGVALCAIGWSGSFRLDLRCALVLLGEVVAVLGVVDLLPAPPLDGGRIATALLERRLGRLRATRVVAHAGEVLAALLAVAAMALTSLPLLAVATVVFAGSRAATGGDTETLALAGIPVEDYAVAAVTVDADATLTEAALRMRDERRLCLAVVEGASLLGALDARDVRQIAPEARALTSARELVRGVRLCTRGASAARVLAALRAARAGVAFIVDDNGLVGAVPRGALESAAEIAALAVESAVPVPVPALATATGGWLPAGDAAQYAAPWRFDATRRARGRGGVQRRRRRPSRVAAACRRRRDGWHRSIVDRCRSHRHVHV